MTVLRRASLILLFLSLFNSGSVCAQDKQPDHSEVLILYQGATSVRWTKRDGTDRVSYRVDSPYPADNIVKWLSGKLESAGWKPPKYDFLNPSLPSPQKNGWWEYLTQITPSKRCAHQWAGEWKNESDDIVSYILRYEETGCETSGLHDLDVFGVYTPAAVAQAARSAAEQNNKEHGSK